MAALASSPDSGSDSATTAAPVDVWPSTSASTSSSVVVSATACLGLGLDGGVARPAGLEVDDEPVDGPLRWGLDHFLLGRRGGVGEGRRGEAADGHEQGRGGGHDGMAGHRFSQT